MIPVIVNQPDQVVRCLFVNSESFGLREKSKSEKQKYQEKERNLIKSGSKSVKWNSSALVISLLLLIPTTMNLFTQKLWQFILNS
jgi:hypothetical protein